MTREHVSSTGGSGADWAKGPYYPLQIVEFVVGLHYRLLLSFRDVEILLRERGVCVSHESVRSWAGRCSETDRHPDLFSEWRRDEAVVRIRRQPVVLWTAVDPCGQLMDIFVQQTRNAQAAERALRRGIHQQQHLADLAREMRLGRARDEVLRGRNPGHPKADP